MVHFDLTKMTIVINTLQLSTQIIVKVNLVVTHLLLVPVPRHHPPNDVGVHLGEDKRSVVFDSQVSLLDGLNWTWATAVLT